MKPLRIVALPKDANPYQELLYGAMEADGASVVYACRIVRTNSVNVMLLPLELILRRLSGATVLHIHWTYGLRLPGCGFAIMRRVSRWWFGLTLACARAAGLLTVWTVHNVLPHTPVFDDDIAARRQLVAASGLVLAHSQHALEALTALGARPQRAAVIPVASVAPPALAGLPAPAFRRVRTILFFGLVEPYKGVDDLLAATARMGSELRVLIAGRCSDDGLRARLERLAQESDADVELRLQYIPDDAVSGLFNTADVVAYPFRRATTSSSVLLGLAAGRPLLVPDLPVFADLPADALIRYTPGEDGLTQAVASVAALPADALAAKARAAREASDALITWDEMARRTARAMHAAIDSAPAVG